MIHKKKGWFFTILGMSSLLLTIIIFLLWTTKIGADPILIIAIVLAFSSSFIVLIVGLVHFQNYLLSPEAIQKRYERKVAYYEKAHYPEKQITIADLFYYLHRKRIGNETLIKIDSRMFVLSRVYIPNKGQNATKSLYCFSGNYFATYEEMLADTTILGRPLSEANISLLLDGKKAVKDLSIRAKEKISYRFSRNKRTLFFIVSGILLIVISLFSFLFIGIGEITRPNTYLEVRGIIKEIKTESQKCTIILKDDIYRYQMSSVQYAAFPYHNIQKSEDNEFIGKEAIMTIRPPYTYRDMRVQKDVVAAYIFAISIDGVAYITLEQSKELQKQETIYSVSLSVIALSCGGILVCIDYYYSKQKLMQFRNLQMRKNQ